MQVLEYTTVFTAIYIYRYIPKHASSYLCIFVSICRATSVVYRVYDMYTLYIARAMHKYINSYTLGHVSLTHAYVCTLEGKVYYIEYIE